MTTAITKATITTPEAPAEQTAVSIKDAALRLGTAGGAAVRFGVAELSAATGERLALTGPSGCGKSTLLNLVAGLIRPESGEVHVLGERVDRLRGWKADAFRGRRIGFVYQSHNLIDAFTAEDNVLIGMRFGRAVARAERKARARDLLTRVGLEKRRHSRPPKLSVGERQRVAIARALANRPALLLADEPTGSLDPKTAQSVLDLMLELCAEENCTLLLVTHDEEIAGRLPRRFDCRDLVTTEAAA